MPPSSDHAILGTKATCVPNQDVSIKIITEIHERTPKMTRYLFILPTWLQVKVGGMMPWNRPNYLETLPVKNFIKGIQEKTSHKSDPWLPKDSSSLQHLRRNHSAASRLYASAHRGEVQTWVIVDWCRYWWLITSHIDRIKFEYGVQSQPAGVTKSEKSNTIPPPLHKSVLGVWHNVEKWCLPSSIDKTCAWGTILTLITQR